MSYAGGAVTYRVELHDGTMILARVALPDGRPDWRGGDEVSVDVRPVPCRLLA